MESFLPSLVIAIFLSHQSYSPFVRCSADFDKTSDDGRSLTELHRFVRDTAEKESGEHGEEEFLLSRHKRAPRTLRQMRIDVINAHNKRRREVQASDMQLLTWDEKIAQKAQEHANKCVFEHSKLQDRVNRGENLFAFYGNEDKMNASVVVDSWYKELKYYHYENNTCDRICGHYKQVVNAQSNKLGCAISPRCKRLLFPKIQPWKNAYLVVCQYSPKLVYGRRPYKKDGKPCSACGPTLQCDRGLCRVPNCGGKKCGAGKLLQDSCECDCSGTGSRGYRCEQGGGGGGRFRSGSESLGSQLRIYGATFLVLGVGMVRAVALLMN